MPLPLVLPTTEGLLVEQAPGERGGENSRGHPAGSLEHVLCPSPGMIVAFVFYS